MSDTTSSLHRKIGNTDEYQSVVRTMKTFAAPSIGQNTSRFQAEFSGKLLSAMRFELGGHIEKSAGKHRRESRDLQVLRKRVPVQRSAYRCYKLVLRAVLIGSVCSVLISAAMAQEPVGKDGEPQKLTAPAKEELSPAPAHLNSKKRFKRKF